MNNLKKLKYQVKILELESQNKALQEENKLLQEGYDFKTTQCNQFAKDLIEQANKVLKL